MNTVPEHIAIIMDGNGRYAKLRNKIRSFGHIEGAKRVEPICRYCEKLGIRYLTLYAFSTENNKRPKKEVDTIMALLNSYIGKFLKPMLENNMRFRVVGNRERIQETLRNSIEKMEKETEKNTGLCLILAIQYGGQDEIVRAVNRLLNQNLKVDEKGIEDSLDTFDIPNPDLIIRTGGERRLSNFLLWQSTYSELYFSDKLWPEFMEADLLAAVEDYQNRKRRFGGL